MSSNMAVLKSAGAGEEHARNGKIVRSVGVLMIPPIRTATSSAPDALGLERTAFEWCGMGVACRSRIAWIHGPSAHLFIPRQSDWFRSVKVAFAAQELDFSQLLLLDGPKIEGGVRADRSAAAWTSVGMPAVSLWKRGTCAGREFVRRPDHLPR